MCDIHARACVACNRGAADPSGYRAARRACYGEHQHLPCCRQCAGGDGSYRRLDAVLSLDATGTGGATPAQCGSAVTRSAACTRPAIPHRRAAAANRRAAAANRRAAAANRRAAAANRRAASDRYATADPDAADRFAASGRRAAAIVRYCARSRLATPTECATAASTVGEC